MDRLVTVVIPVFNRKQELVRALSSLADQTFGNFEVIICDDGSTDGSAEAANSFATTFPLRVIRQDNSGLPAAARNLGLQEAQTEFVAFLDSDDFWHPRKLEVSLRVLEAGNDLVFHDLLCKYPTTARFRSRVARSRSLGKNPHSFLLLHGNCIPTSSVVMRRSLIDHVGLQSESQFHRGWEDYEYWLRVTRVTSRVKRVRRRLGSYWVSGSGDSSSQLLSDLIDRMGSAVEGQLGFRPNWLAFAEARSSILGGHVSAGRRAILRVLFRPGLRLRSDHLRIIKLLLVTYFVRKD